MTEKEQHRIADKWIRELRAAGFTYDEMLIVIKKARYRYLKMKKRDEKIHAK